MKSIFLSYSTVDREIVHRLAHDLEENGVRVWYYEAELMIGDSFLDRISEAIAEFDYLGVFLSKSSVSSSWVKKELAIASTREVDGKEVKVLPILIEKCTIPGFLVDKVHADITTEEKYQIGVKALLKRLEVDDAEVKPGSKGRRGDKNYPDSFKSIQIILDLFFAATLLIVFSYQSIFAGKVNPKIEPPSVATHALRLDIEDPANFALTPVGDIVGQPKLKHYRPGQYQIMVREGKYDWVANMVKGACRLKGTITLDGKRDTLILKISRNQCPPGKRPTSKTSPIHPEKADGLLIAGNIQTQEGKALSGVQVSAKGGVIKPSLTDENGDFTFRYDGKKGDALTLLFRLQEKVHSKSYRVDEKVRADFYINPN